MCNGCSLERLKKELGDNFLLLGTTVYELNAQPSIGQGLPVEHNGVPIRFKAWFMSTGHSDECTKHWKDKLASKGES